MLQDPLLILVLVACAAVAVILGLGIGTFGKGGPDNGKRANKYMRWRLIAQFVAVLVILLFVYLRSQGGQ